MPINDAIQRMFQSARELDESANKMATEHDQHARNNFGQRIADAVRRKTPRHAAMAVFAKNDGDDDNDDDENGEKDKDADSFAECLKKAVQRKSGQKQHKEQAERERSRYQQPQPRQRTKGE
jgi:hypothetical protein